MTDNGEVDDDNTDTNTVGDTEDVTTDDDHVATAVTDSGDVQRWRRRALVATVLLVASLVGCGFLAHALSVSKGRENAEAAATVAAERIVMSWLTYDYRTYKSDMSWVSTSGTPKFKKEFSAPALEGMRKQIVGPRQLVSLGRVVNSAATASDSDHAKVLIFTDQRVTDKDIRKADGAPLHARSGVEMDMVRSNGKWLIDDMKQLQFQ